jgi:hypothetical protein
VFEMSFELYFLEGSVINYGDYRRDCLLVVTKVYEPLFWGSFWEESLLSGLHISLEMVYYFHVSTALIPFI